MKLRDYQRQLVSLSKGNDNVLLQADTGAGKTPVLAEIAKQNKFVLVVAHRNLLIRQASKMLAKFGIKHDVLATEHTRRLCILEHRKNDLGDGFITRSNKYVCSIDSILSRYRRNLLTVDRSQPWVILVDEAHHMIDQNKWGKLVEIFPNSRIIGVTATPCRLDGVSLARSKGGVFDRLEQAESLRENSVRTLIELGYVSDFKCYSVPERIDYERLKIGTHDYTYRSLNAATNAVVFEMAGDAVANYKRLADGKQALAFCASIEIAQETAEYFKNNGVSAAAIHSKMSAVDVSRVFDLFERKHIKVLCNVDMVGEGVDVPAIEALIMLRKTASFGMYRQWIGRSLRPEKGKDHAIIIDHVGNIRTHDLPDKHIEWSLENPPQAGKSCLIPCPKCAFLVRAWEDICPECGASLQRHGESGRKTDVEYIDYDLVRVERERIDKEKVEAARKKDFAENLQFAKENPKNMSAINRSIYRLKVWMSEVLMNEGVSIYDLNVFFAEKDQSYWLNNFTFADVVKDNKSKAIQKYNKDKGKRKK